jgi:hypothetical protein
MVKPNVTIGAAAFGQRLLAMEHLAHHAVSLLRRAKATVETIQSLAYECSLPWAVDETVRELDPETIETIKAVCEDLIEEIREASREADASSDDEAEGDNLAVEAERHIDEGKPVPCAS